MNIKLKKKKKEKIKNEREEELENKEKERKIIYENENENEVKYEEFEEEIKDKNELEKEEETIIYETYEEVKSYVRISFDHFTPSKNPHFRDCIVEIDILCHPEYWDIGNFRQRPIKIAGYIDGILNESRLSGLGTLQFAGANELLLDENLAGYCLMYAAVHGSDDYIEDED